MQTVQNDSVLGEVKHTNDLEIEENIWQGSFAITGFDQPVPFEFNGEEIDDPEEAFVVLRSFMKNSELFLQSGADGLRDFLQKHGEVFGLDDEKTENFLQLSKDEFKAILQEPLVKVLKDDEGDLLLLLAFHDCPLDEEHGVGIIFKNDLFSEITDGYGELGMYSS